ncbi:MAG TPA: MarR family transcriptional regulator [Conexibacter sp.]|jgi:DNA-binding MarR family transcriptional regulator
MSEPGRTSWRIMRDLVLDHHRRQAVADEVGLSFARTRALLKLADAAEPLTMRALAERLQTDAPYTTLIVADLEQRGLVERSVDPRDRRAKIVRTTVAGEALARRADKLLDVLPAALTELPAEDLAALDRILAALRAEG